MKEHTYEIYEPFKILTPDWSCTRDEKIITYVNKLTWNICRLLPWYKTNPFHPHLLVRLNKWTRPWHLESDYFREPSSAEVWNSIGTTLKKIARI